MLTDFRKIIAIAAIGVAGFLPCACTMKSSTGLFRPGAGSAQKQYDLDQCKIASLRSIPQAFTTRTTGGLYDPGSLVCSLENNGKTVCIRRSPVYVPSSSISVDQNDALRRRFVLGCLQKKGYSIIDRLPPCTSKREQENAVEAQMVSAFTCNPDMGLDY